MGAGGNFNLDEYEPVEDRIRRFYADHNDGRIITDLRSSVDKPETAIFIASVYIGEELKATGWAMEKEGVGYVNKTSHIENCETSAIGRALANFNYQGSKRPSREEMEKVARGESAVDYSQMVKRLTSAQTLDELKESFIEVYKGVGSDRVGQKVLTKAKDKRKKELT